MEIVTGTVMDMDGGGMTIRCPCPRWERGAMKQGDSIRVGLPDGRTISPAQSGKAHALIGEIAEWSGYTPLEAKRVLKRAYMAALHGDESRPFSLRDCDMATASGFIDYLVAFAVDNGVQTRQPLSSLCEDIRRYVYVCLRRKKCAVCGRRADLHHVDRVGMGRDRRHMNHIGLLALPLCREHHTLLHNVGDGVFLSTYHLEPVEIDDDIRKAYELSKQEEKR